MNTISNLLKEIQEKYDIVVNENARLREENKKLNSELAKDIKLSELNKELEQAKLESQHYGMPFYLWDRFEDLKEENDIPHWDKFIIEELTIATAYTAIYKDKEFTEYC